MEIKSLNSKNLDLNTHAFPVPRKGIGIARSHRQIAHPGKVDFNLFVEITGEETSTLINDAVVKQHMKQLRGIVEGDDLEL